jgi:hypothetical protein
MLKVCFKVKKKNGIIKEDVVQHGIMDVVALPLTIFREGCTLIHHHKITSDRWTDYDKAIVYKVK